MVFLSNLNPWSKFVFAFLVLQKFMYVKYCSTRSTRDVTKSGFPVVKLGIEVPAKPIKKQVLGGPFPAIVSLN